MKVRGYKLTRQSNLVGADLSGACLNQVDIAWSNLRGANLSEVSASSADFANCNFRGANLRDSAICRSWMMGCDFQGADMRGMCLLQTRINGADLRGAILPDLDELLLCEWQVVSDDLCRELMRYDASLFPYPRYFDDWARGEGLCPYLKVDIFRAVNFSERKALWSPGPALGKEELVQRLFKEKNIKSDI